MSSLGELILVGVAVFVLASPVLYLVMTLTGGALEDIGDSPTQSTLVWALLGVWWCRRFWRRYKARRRAHDLHYRHGIGPRP